MRLPAVSHLAAGTSSDALFTVSFMNDRTREHVARHEPRSAGGVGSAPLRPGLGIELDEDLLDEPLPSVEAR